MEQRTRIAASPENELARAELKHAAHPQGTIGVEFGEGLRPRERAESW